jgi:hypothetical protein
MHAAASATPAPEEAAGPSAADRAREPHRRPRRHRRRAADRDGAPVRAEVHDGPLTRKAIAENEKGLGIESHDDGPATIHEESKAQP